MGGKMWVESEPGAGSTFHFTAALELGPEPASRGVAQIPAGVRALIVDDNAANRRIFAERLRRWQMQPTCVSRGREAVDVLTAAVRDGRPFELVLLDANMPDLDGFGVAQEIARNPQLAGSTIMMLSSSGEYGDASRCRALVIATFLSKPIGADELLEAIQSAFESRGAPARLVPFDGPPGNPQAPPSSRRRRP